MPRVNTDEILQDFGDWRNISDVMKAGKIAVKKIAEYFVDGAQKRSIMKYYSDMLKVSKKCNQLLKENGLCIFVIGDTEYKETKIENARCLAESLILNGFEIIEISKRKVENKFLPSHRDKNGKFSSDKTDRQIYSKEYIIIGSKISGEA